MMSKRYTFLVLLTFSTMISRAQGVQPKLQKIIFHSSACFGSCPKIDLQLDSNLHLYVNRQFYKGKATPVKEYSGSFTGTINSAEYQQLKDILKRADYNNLNFPDVTCCDGPIKTVIIYADGKRKYLKSMTPPAEANELINWLTSLGVRKNLATTAENKPIEE